MQPPLPMAADLAAAGLAAAVWAAAGSEADWVAAAQVEETDWEVEDWGLAAAVSVAALVVAGSASVVVDSVGDSAAEGLGSGAADWVVET